MSSARVVEPALTLTIPQLRAAVARRLRGNAQAGRDPQTRYALAVSLGVAPCQVYMVLGGRKNNRRLRVLLEEFAGA